MKAFEEAVKKKVIPWLVNCKIIKRNTRLGSSLIDYLFKCTKELLYLEVKSAVLRGDEIYAMYPDLEVIL